MFCSQKFYRVISKIDTDISLVKEKLKDQREKIPVFVRSGLVVQEYNFLKVANEEEDEQILAGQKSGQAKNCLTECLVVPTQFWLTEK